MEKSHKPKRRDAFKAAISATIPVAIPTEALPPLVERPLAARFTKLHPRTLARAELRGLLTPIKRNKRVVLYEKGELLRYYGIES